MRPLTFCDIATFYCRAGGGIRTYYDATLDWFRRQHRHRDVLIIPDQRSSRRAMTPSVTLVETRGIGVTRSHEASASSIASSRNSSVRATAGRGEDPAASF
jgi:hypothetical protein